MSTYRWLIRVYAGPGLDDGRLDAQAVHAQVAAVLTTGVLMWAYAAVACEAIDHPLPCMVGIGASLAHLLSPFAFRFHRDPLLPCSLMLAAGLVHQTTFAWFTGGFHSSTLIWIAVLPWLGGIIAGLRGAVLWTLICLVVAAVALTLQTRGQTFPDLISPAGRTAAQAIMLFGWILLSLIMIVVHIIIRRHAEREVGEQKRRIETLFRSLYHDLATPLSSLALRIGRSDEGSERQRALAAALDIVANARADYLSGRDGPGDGGARIDQAVDAVVALHQGLARAKRVELHSVPAALAGVLVAGDATVITHHVLGNLLGNALKFAPLGSVVRISAELHGDRICVTISDQGCGMPEADLLALDAGQPVTVRTGTAGEPGGGFGLLVVRSWLLRYGGQLELTNPSTGGLAATAWFRWRLPNGQVAVRTLPAR